MPKTTCRFVWLICASVLHLFHSFLSLFLLLLLLFCFLFFISIIICVPSLLSSHGIRHSLTHSHTDIKYLTYGSRNIKNDHIICTLFKLPPHKYSEECIKMPMCFTVSYFGFTFFFDALLFRLLNINFNQLNHISTF